MLTDTKEHLLKLIDFIYNEVCNSARDGDLLWYVTHYKFNDILELIYEYNLKLQFPWDVKLEEGNIHWGADQEWVLITTSKETYLDAPTWQQCIIKT